MSTAIERLRTAEHLGRRLHTVVPDADVGSMVRTWPAVAVAAHHASLAFSTQVSSAGIVTERIALGAMALDSAQDRHLWPGVGRFDPTLSSVQKHLKQATDLASHQPVPKNDVAEGQRLIASTLWTVSRTIATYARDASFDLRYDDTVTEARSLRASQLAYDTSLRLNVGEQLAANIMFGREQMGIENAGPASLHSAIARWDVEAHRALVDQRSTATLHVVAFYQADFALRLQDFLQTSAIDGIVDRTTHGRLLPVLQHSHQAWKEILDIASEFSFASIVVPAALHDAGGLLHKQLNLAPPHSSDGHRIVLSALSDHLASSLDIATVVRDLLEDGNLRAPARAVNRVVNGRFPDVERAIVSPVDIQRGVTVVLPSEARDLLHLPATRAVEVCAEGMTRSSSLDFLYQETPTTSRDVAPEQPSQKIPRSSPTLTSSELTQAPTF